ncbi:MAG: cytochrome c [Sulfurovum sp.]|nr:cytochrome c [Sulfurovum sp.]MCB4762516.1 cytochrome c [Sulfurovum sp.]MCB4784356.1 cytochrome c [Sulfurovum sp.]
MKKIILVASILFLAMLTLDANSDGASVYKAKCKTCHMLKPTMGKKKMMKAPPMSKVSAKLKYDFKGNKTQIVAFIKDYIVNPAKKKAHCMPMALKKFGVMPPIGKSLKPKELDLVANWIVDNFNHKWDPKAMGTGCASKTKGKKMMKCGGGMKCAAGKCGSKMKCGGK